MTSTRRGELADPRHHAHHLPGERCAEHVPIRLQAELALRRRVTHADLKPQPRVVETGKLGPGGNSLPLRNDERDQTPGDFRTDHHVVSLDHAGYDHSRRRQRRSP
jgi:hypothetical protein